MTMPHLMNCAHLADGWCLDCVGEQHAEIERLKTHAVILAATAEQVERERWVELLRSWIDDAERESGPEAAGWLEKAIEQLEQPR